MTHVITRQLNDRLVAWRRRTIRELQPFRVVGWLVMLVVAALAVYPLLRVLLRLAFDDGRPTAAVVRDVVDQPELGRVLLNTLVLVVSSTGVGVAVAAGLAWILERTDARMGTLTAALPLLPFLLPPIAGAVGWVLALSERAGLVNHALRSLLSVVGVELDSGPFNIYSWPGLVGVTSLYIAPYAYLTITAGLRNMDPSLEEQARVCGAGRFKVLRTVTLPAIRPNVGAGLLLAIWVAVSIFSVPIILGTGSGIEVLSVRIVRLLRSSYPAEMGAAVGLSTFILASVGLVWIMQRRSLRSGTFASSGGKGVRPTLIRLGPWRWPARLLVIAYLAIAVAVPLSCLLIVALRGFWTTDISISDLGFGSFNRVFEDRFSRDAISNSIRLGLLGGLVGTGLAAVIALHVRKTDLRASRVLDGLIKLPAVVSAIVIGVGFILAFSGPPFRLGGSLSILFIGYLALYMPQATVAADAAAATVGRELSEASAVSGGGPGRTFRKVELPIMMPGLVAAWALLFARVVEEVTLSALLATPGNIVIGPRILEIFENATYADLAAISIVLTGLTSLVVAVVLFISGRLGVARALRASGGGRPSGQSVSDGPAGVAKGSDTAP